MMQVSFPLIVQLITTPCHLYGLDVYNEKSSSFGARMSRISGKYVSTVGLRMIRMFPPWSVGLVANREIGKYIRNNIE